jgi:hypothetical protein
MLLYYYVVIILCDLTTGDIDCDILRWRTYLQNLLLVQLYSIIILSKAQRW